MCVVWSVDEGETTVPPPPPSPESFRNDGTCRVVGRAFRPLESRHAKISCRIQRAIAKNRCSASCGRVARGGFSLLLGRRLRLAVLGEGGDTAHARDPGLGVHDISRRAVSRRRAAVGECVQAAMGLQCCCSQWAVGERCLPACERSCGGREKRVNKEEPGGGSFACSSSRPAETIRWLAAHVNGRHASSVLSYSRISRCDHYDATGDI